MNTSKYRQSVVDFQRRLSILAQETNRRSTIDKKTGKIKEPRVLIDTTKTRTIVVPGAHDYRRIVWYGQRRYLSVCRVLALMEKLKVLETLKTRISVSHSKAYWQSVRGSDEHPACHTCPALLLLNGRLPTLLSPNLAWRRHVIAVFADCMLMPKAINDIDGVIDSLDGRDGFAAVVSDLLNSPEQRWWDAARNYRELMREYFSPLWQLTDAADPRIQALQGFYEGLYLTSETAEIKYYISVLERSL